MVEKRGGKKIADVTITPSGKINPREIPRLFVAKSGFKSRREWLETLKAICGFIPKEVYLYRVVLGHKEPKTVRKPKPKPKPDICGQCVSFHLGYCFVDEYVHFVGYYTPACDRMEKREKL